MRRPKLWEVGWKGKWQGWGREGEERAGKQSGGEEGRDKGGKERQQREFKGENGKGTEWEGKERRPGR